MQRKRSLQKILLGSVTTEDIIKTLKSVSRDVFGVIPSKVHKNKKKYTRKQKHKINLEDSN